MAKVNNSPTNWKEGLSEVDNSNLLDVFNRFRELPPVHKEDTEEIRERLGNYFEVCTDRGVLPTVESMGLVLGVSRQTMWKWQQSECDAGLLVARAKEVINAVIATATINGKINPVYSIWLQKNHFGYSDTQTLQVENITDKRPLTAAELPNLREWKAKQNAEQLPQLEQESYTNN